MSATQPRLRACVEAWPDAHEGGYDPRCCRFPKSCSADVYDPAHVTAEDLECPAMTAPEPTRPADEHIDAVARACLLALHDQTCPEGGDCRARWPHAAASGWFDGPRFIRDVSNAAAIHEALAANLPAEVMLAALVRAGHPVGDVIKAWEVAGRAPTYHRSMKAQLRKAWPTLHSALQRLSRVAP